MSLEQPTSARKKRALFRVLTVIICLAVSLALAELAARFAESETDRRLWKGESVYRFTKNPLLLYEYRPLANHTWKGIQIRINASGFRDHDYSKEKREGIFRIAVLGDSVMFGGDMKLELIAAKRMEAMLNARKAGKFEVLNFAVPGYDIVQEVELFKTRVKDYEPDLVIFGYCLNDPDPTRGELDFIHQHPDLSALRPGKGSWLAILCDHLYLARSLYRLGSRYQGAIEAREHIRQKLNEMSDPYATRRDINEELFKEIKEHGKKLDLTAEQNRQHFQEYYASLHINLRSWQRVADSLDELKKANQRSTPIVVAIIPVAVSFKDYFLRPIHDFLATEIENRGFNAVDLLPRFEKEAPEDLALSDGDRVHYSTRGHAVLAEALIAAMEELKLLSETESP